MQRRGLGGRKRGLEGESLISSLNFLLHFILILKIFIVLMLILMLLVLKLIVCLYFSFGKNHVKYNR